MTPEQAQNHVVELLRFVGEDPLREGLRDTPRRVVESWKELLSGYKTTNPKDILTIFEENHDEMVVLRDIEFFSTCEHHWLPFFGKAHIGYLPSGPIVGVSKLARLVDVYARRLSVQERIGVQVAQALQGEPLCARGVGVVLEAQHLCMCARGVGKQNSVMVTSTMLGLFREDAKVRSEFLGMIGKG